MFRKGLKIYSLSKAGNPRRGMEFINASKVPYSGSSINQSRFPLRLFCLLSNIENKPRETKT
jgi:hypothetical protein